LHLETRHRTRDGRLLPVELTANLISFEGQEYVCAFARDITERRRHETERAEHQRELEHRNQELDAFAYVASHDLKAPLRAIGNLAKWIEEDAKDRLTGESRRHLDTLTQRVQRMEGLLEDMLKYSRAGRQGGEPEDVRTASLVAEIVDMIAPPASFEVQVSPDLPHLRTPKAPLRQVFLNLIANAVKHHDRPAGTITVSARDAGELVEFAVADDGPGIPTEFQERVFGMFQTLKPRDEVEGSGMGLAVIRKVVELQRGRVTLESEGRGATFRFTWPKQPASRAAESADLVGSA
jgi:signal transduction histidine kinase